MRIKKRPFWAITEDEEAGGGASEESGEVENTENGENAKASDDSDDSAVKADALVGRLDALEETAGRILDLVSGLVDGMAAFVENGGTVRDADDDADDADDDEADIEDIPIEDMDFSLDDEKED